jgi:hypothetical protein
MALPIKHPPILTGEAAKRFNELADRNYNNKLAKESKTVKSILLKAKL